MNKLFSFKICCKVAFPRQPALPCRWSGTGWSAVWRSWLYQCPPLASMHLCSWWINHSAAFGRISHVLPSSLQEADYKTVTQKTDPVSTAAELAPNSSFKKIWVNYRLEYTQITDLRINEMIYKYSLSMIAMKCLITIREAICCHLCTYCTGYTISHTLSKKATL